jgi:hypothetical protein
VVVLFLPKSLVIGGGSSNEAFYSDFRWYCWVVSSVSLISTVVALVYFSLLKTSQADEGATDAKTFGN